MGVAAISHGGKAVSLLGVDGEWSAGSVGSESDRDGDAPFGADIELEGLIALDEGFVALGSDYTNFTSQSGGTVAVAYWSDDGLTWQRMDLDTPGGDNGRIRDAARLGGTLIGIGFTTADGISYGATWVLGADAG